MPVWIQLEILGAEARLAKLAALRTRESNGDFAKSDGLKKTMTVYYEWIYASRGEKCMV